jgi:hypothetical protein
VSGRRAVVVAQPKAPHPATVRADREMRRPHPATVAQPRAPHPATVAQPRAPHPATVVADRPIQRKARIDAGGGVAQRTKVDPNYKLYTTFVLAPTRDAYLNANSKDLANELDELEEMAKKDITYLTDIEKANVCPKVIYTGYSGGKGTDTALSDCFIALSGLQKNTKITFVLTAHGSPGIKGKIGMGYDEDGKPDYRLTAPMLGDLLKKKDIKKLKKLDLHFIFRSCNSAYVPLDRYTKVSRATKIKVIDHSFIGCFHSTASSVLKLDVTVTGFRGYYFPSRKTPKVSADKKKMFLLEEGSVTILSNRDVVFGDEEELFKIQSTKLDELFEI